MTPQPGMSRDLGERVATVEKELDIFIKRYERENLANSRELQELILIVRIFGVKWLLILAVVFYLLWPFASHKIAEVLGLLNK